MTNLLPVCPPQNVLDYISLHYHYDEGQIYKLSTNIKSYIKLGSYASGRYIVLVLQEHLLQRSHIVWFLHHKVWPHMEIDHIDRDASNDRIENLRLATRSLQNTNRNFKPTKSGYRGVYRTGRWYQAQIRKDGVRYVLPHTKTAEESFLLYKKKYIELWGFEPNA